MEEFLKLNRLYVVTDPITKKVKHIFSGTKWKYFKKHLFPAADAPPDSKLMDITILDFGRFKNGIHLPFTEVTKSFHRNSFYDY